MAYDLSRLGPLYAKAGFETPPAVVQARLAAAATAAGAMSAKDFVPVLRLALGLKAEVDELASFLTPFKEDPTFAATPGSAELRLLACGVVTEAMRGGAPSTQALPVIAMAGLFGRMRAPPMDPDFIGFIEEALAARQRSELSGPGYLGPLTGVVMTKALAPVAQKVAASDFAAAITDLNGVVTSVANNGVAQDEKLRGQVNAVAAKLAALGEQMEIQWWAANASSLEAAGPFSAMGAGEAAARAAKELADLTQRACGVLSAPALLDRVLPVKSQRQKLTLKELATAPPLLWRDTWSRKGPDLPDAALMPVVHAFWVASQAEDQPDWEGRFEREVGVPLATDLKPLDWARQLYLEALSVKALAALDE